MLNMSVLRDNPDLVKKAIADRNMKLNLDAILDIEAKRRTLLHETEALKSQRNTVSKEIGVLKKNGEDASALMSQMKEVSAQIKAKDTELSSVEASFKQELLTIPNIPHESVPVGADEDANVEIKTWGEKNEFLFEPKTHWELAESLDIIDFKRGAKLTGSGFILYKNAGARLERSLINFMLDLHTDKHGYSEVFPPFLVNRDSMIGTGQLPKMENDMYHATEDDLFLIPTAEVPVTNIYRNEILAEEDLPLCYAAYTPCFRREAGSYGKDTKGLNRVHQFDKVEMVKFVHPRHSYDELELLLDNAEEVLRQLNIPYRVLSLCTGDISFAAAKCYDIEAWSAGQQAYLEVSSCSNFEDFQARRANIRYRSKDDKKPKYLHTLNGSGIALARTVAVILENYQNEDGSITVPEVLVPYMGCDKIII